jgi:predicted aspartyl protease
MPVRWIALGLVVLLVGCVTPWLPSVVVDSRVGAQLSTRQRHGIFLATVRIGDREAGPFVLDTGASHLVLDVELARTLGLRAWAASQDRATGATATFVTVPALRAGRVTMRNMTAVVTDLSAVASALGERPAGLLGHPFFAKAVVEFDYRRRAVACFAPGTYGLAEEHWQELRFKGELPAMVGRLDGNAEGEFLLDTGSTALVYLTSTFIRKHVFLDIRDIRPAREVRLTGERDTFQGAIGWFELGGHRLERPRITFSREAHAADVDATAALDGIVGHGLLQRFVVVFNYPEARIALLRNR